MELIGIIPAAGRASRLSIPFSKELYPFVIPASSDKEGFTIVPVISFLLDRMKTANVKKIFMIINKEKFDILRYLGSGKNFGLDISYLVQEVPAGMPSALAMVYPWSNMHTTFVFGMPDTIFYPREALSSLLEKHFFYNSEVTVGIFPTDKPNKFGMVEFDQDMNLVDVIDKPKSTDLKFMWGIACWNMSFMQFMVEYIKLNSNYKKEIVLSEIFKSAIERQMRIKVCPFFDGEYYDIGTTDDLFTTIEKIRGIHY